MENILSLNVFQQLFILAVYLWMFIGFPVLLLGKLNYIASLLEAQVYQDEDDDDHLDAVE